MVPTRRVVGQRENPEEEAADEEGAFGAEEVVGDDAHAPAPGIDTLAAGRDPPMVNTSEAWPIHESSALPHLHSMEEEFGGFGGSLLADQGRCAGFPCSGCGTMQSANWTSLIPASATLE